MRFQSVRNIYFESESRWDAVAYIIMLCALFTLLTSSLNFQFPCPHSSVLASDISRRESGKRFAATTAHSKRSPNCIVCVHCITITMYLLHGSLVESRIAAAALPPEDLNLLATVPHARNPNQ